VVEEERPVRRLAAPLLWLMLWLMLSASAGVSQTLSFPEGLEPFRINAIEVDHPDSVQLRLWGERFDGTAVPLFSGAGIPLRGGLLCYAYLDEEIRLLRGESRSSSGGKTQLSAEVRRSEFRISVYGFPGPLGGGSPWQVVRSEEELGPGDIYVLSPQDDPAPIMAAGIHVLTPRARSTEIRDPRNPWRGYLLIVSDLEANTLIEALESRREEIIAFKQRYTNLPASLGFHGARVPRQDPLIFPASPPASIAQSLQGETFHDRVGAPYRYALLAFSFAAIIAVTLIRRWTILLPLMGFLLAVFVVFTFAAPSRLRSLTIELALPANQEDSSGRTVALESVSEPAKNILRYRQRDIPPGSRSLLYRSFLAPGGEAPLRLFTADRWVRFNQIPEVQQRQGSLFLKFRNPLSSWSLHEPQ
jgi:hypothetical protein